MAADGGDSTPEQSLSVVPEHVQKLGRFIYGQAQTLRNGLDAADKDVAGLMSDSWHGPAATAFVNGWSECRDGGGKIVDTLTELAGKLGITATNYLDHDSRSTDGISSLSL